MFMIMYVLNDPDRLNEVLEAWESANIPGATIIESTGMHRQRRKFIPMRYITPIFEDEESHLTLITLVKDESLIQTCLEATERVVGDLREPNTGVFTAWPVAFVKGLEQDKA